MQSRVIYELASLTGTLRSDFKAKTDDHRQIFEKSDKKVASLAGKATRETPNASVSIQRNSSGILDQIPITTLLPTKQKIKSL